MFVKFTGTIEGQTYADLLPFLTVLDNFPPLEYKKEKMLIMTLNHC